MTSKGGPAQRRSRPRFDDNAITRQGIKRGTVRRIVPYALQYRGPVSVLLLATVAIAVTTAASPLVLKAVIDDGILPGSRETMLWLCAVVAGAALLEAAAMYVQAWATGRIGEGVVYDLRNKVFAHVQRQSVAFFARAQTGSLVSRLNSDVIGARDAMTAILSGAVSTVLTLILVLVAMFYLSWQITVVALLIVPLFLLPTRLVARRLQRLTRERMEADARMGSMMHERFNVSGALIVKLYGRTESESGMFAEKAGRVRDISVLSAVYGRIPGIIVGLLTALTTAFVYGMGGVLVTDGTLELGTVVAMAALLMRLYSPIDQLVGLQSAAMTALVSFDRVFEVLDLQPLITEHPHARDLPAKNTPPTIDFDNVTFHYPTDDTSLASLEDPTTTPHTPTPHTPTPVLHHLTFTASAGKLTALVGPSGAGKTTLTQLIPRLYDPTTGNIRINGHDTRDLTLNTLRNTIGVVSQDPHLFHDTLRANLQYANPHA
ncbi:ABC transporter ATP-binding protein, partial [Streptomyces sp. NPDC058171]